MRDLSDGAIGAGRRVLVVDDSVAQRKLLAARLRRWGFSVTEAEDGLDALTCWEADPFDLAISDWMMPRLDGPGLVGALRDRQGRDGYTYFILLTAKRERNAVAKGLQAGADDFLAKPFDDGELLARLTAGLRLLDAKARIAEKNAETERAYARLRGLYDAIDRDLQAAAAVQREQLPPPCVAIPGGRIAHLCRPLGHVGGDLVGHFPVEENRICVYAVDVAGHGISSCLVTIRIAQMLRALEGRLRAGTIDPSRGPAEIVGDLNTRLGTGLDHDLYCTLSLAILDLATGNGRLCQAGHPPAILAHGGQTRLIGDGGLPVGLLPDLDYAEVPFTLPIGGRVILYSDGLTEQHCASGDQFGEAALARAALAESGTLLEHFPTKLVDRVGAACGGGSFEDDVSLIALERLSLQS